jgi:hypothetical protein
VSGGGSGITAVLPPSPQLSDVAGWGGGEKAYSITKRGVTLSGNKFLANNTQIAKKSVRTKADFFGKLATILHTHPRLSNLLYSGRVNK